MVNKIDGIGNEIVILENGKRVEKDISGLNITITGNNNYVEIELPSKFVSSAVVLEGDNNKFILKSTKI